MDNMQQVNKHYEIEQHVLIWMTDHEGKLLNEKMWGIEQMGYVIPSM